jgi:hypothetical protein
MRPGLEDMFNRETTEFFDENVPYAVRRMKLTRLIEIQERCVLIYHDRSIATPIDPEDVKDSEEYLERLKGLNIPF